MKKKAVQKSLLTHEINSLNVQGVMNLDSLMYRIDPAGLLSDTPDSTPSTLSGGKDAESATEETTANHSSSSSTIKSPPIKKEAVKRGSTFMDKFSASVSNITATDPEILAMELRERETKLQHEEVEFVERLEEKRRKIGMEEEDRKRRFELDERALKLQERQLEAQMQQTALFQALLNKSNNN